MKTLIMLTKFYPYGRGEAFIENEIEIVSQKFDRVILVACDIEKNVTECRKIPANAEVIRVNAEGKLKDIASIVAVRMKSGELKKEFSRHPDIKKKMFAGYFESKSTRIYRSLIKQIDIENLKADEITLYSYWMFVTARVGIMLKKALGDAVKHTFTRAHGYDLYEERNKILYLPMRELILSEYDKIYPCSEHGTKYLSDKYSEYSHKIEPSLLGTMDNGINTQSKDGVFRIVSCSRIEGVKRIDRIVEALALLDDKGIKIEWTHIGGGNLYSSIKAQAEKSLLNIKYIFKGEMKNAEVMEYYKKEPVDLFLNVSSSEGLPVSIMEAISYGIPVIATDVGGTSEIVISEKSGYLIPENFKTEELAAHIERFINGEVCVECIRKEARELWERKFMAVKNYNAICESA